MNKELLIVAGPNGSGKSSLISGTGLNVEYDIINPDNYVNAVMSDYTNDGKTYTGCYIVAMKFCQSLREEYLSKGRSFGFETVASREEKLDFVKKSERARISHHLHVHDCWKP